MGSSADGGLSGAWARRSDLPPRRCDAVAAALFERSFIDVTVSRTRRARGIAGAITHRVTALEPVDVTRLHGFPVTTVARTLLDIAAVVPCETVEEALDDALRRRLVTMPFLRWRLGTWGGHGRRGVAVLRRLVHERGSQPLRDSVLETKLLRALNRAGLRVVPQYCICDGSGRFIARVDAAIPDARIAIEAEGYRWHAGRARWQHDLGRRNELTALGWRVFHLTWEQVTADPHGVARSIRRTLDEDR